MIFEDINAAKKDIPDSKAELPEEVTDIRTHLQENWSTMATQSYIALHSDSAKAGLQVQGGGERREKEQHTA